jgi:ketosteroid isomerase-like protein
MEWPLRFSVKEEVMLKDRMAWVGLCLAVVFAGAVIVGCGDSEQPAAGGGGAAAADLSPEEALTAYMDAARKGDVDGMIAVCASEEAEELREVKEAPAESQKMAIDMLKESAPADFTIEETKVEGDRATITYSGTIGGQKQTEKATLVNENGWKVKSY